MGVAVLRSWSWGRFSFRVIGSQGVRVPGVCLWVPGGVWVMYYGILILSGTLGPGIGGGDGAAYTEDTD